MKHLKKHLKTILSAAAAAAFLLTASLLFFSQDADKKADYKRIDSEEYDSVFLSMYPIDTYEEGVFSYFLALNVLKTARRIPDASELSGYMKRIAKSGNVISAVYLGVRPDLITPGELQNILDRYPSVTFEVILAYPDASYWTGLSQKEYNKMLESYHSFFEQLSSLEHVNYYFWAATEWLVENPGNYLDTWLVNADIAERILLNSDLNHGYNITAENAASLYRNLSAKTAAYRAAPAIYPDLSDHAVIFFGDSVIGNYTDSTSIPGVVAGLTGAAVYNCGYGGGSAAKSSADAISLYDIVNGFLTGRPEVLPEDHSAREQLQAYIENPPLGKKHVFVISYGINDYYREYPVGSVDPFDLGTYAGSLRKSVSALQESFPDAQIVLCTPNFTGRYEGGMEPRGPAGNIFPDYVDAVIKIAEEFHADVLDNYNDLPIRLDNMDLYLDDMVHPGNGTRFTIGSRLADILR